MRTSPSSPRLSNGRTRAHCFVCTVRACGDSMKRGANTVLLQHRTYFAAFQLHLLRPWDSPWRAHLAAWFVEHASEFGPL